MGKTNGKDLKKWLVQFALLVAVQQAVLLMLYRDINEIRGWKALFMEVWEFLLINFTGNCLAFVVYLVFFCKND